MTVESLLYKRPKTIVSPKDIGDHAEHIEQMERAGEARHEFLVEVSYQIRSSLDTIMRFSEVLESEELSGEQKEESHLIHEACRRLILLIGDVVRYVLEHARRNDIETLEYYFGPLLDEVNSIMSAWPDVGGKVPAAQRTREKHETTFYSFSQIND
jgi:signal transduction histidine kinase